MAYAVNNTRGTLLVSLSDNTIDTTTTSLSLIGKNTSNYGEVQNENFVHLTENFAAAAGPATPQEGQLWYDTATRSLNVYRILGNNAGWSATTNSISSSAPSSLLRKDGDTWYDSINKQLRVYNGTATNWDLVGPDYDKDQLLSGQAILTVVDDFASTHYVVGWYINNSLYAIVNKDAEFALSGYSGFTAANIQPGINFSTNFAAKLVGGSGGGVTATNSELLDGLDSLQFLRSDTTDSASGIITFTNTTDSTTINTGAVIVDGGVGIEKSLVVGGGASKFTNAITSTSSTTGAVTLGGGLGVLGNIYAGALQGTPVGSTARSTGAFTTLTSNGATTFTAGTPSTSTITGTGIITGGLGVSGNIYAGAIQNTPVGTIARSTGSFTTLTSNGPTTFTAGTGASNVATGTVVVTGGVGISENLYIGGIFDSPANITTTANVHGANFIGNVTGDAASAATIAIANETGSASTFRLLFSNVIGTTQTVWMDNTGVSYQPSTDKVTATTFAGALDGTANASTFGAITNTTAPATYYVNFVDGVTGARALRAHSAGLTYNPATGGTLTTGTFSGVSTTAQYADLAERYEGDLQYEAGTVVVFGGAKEITVTTLIGDTRVAGVISANPAYLMNSEGVGSPVALRGKVPVKVLGTVNKGDLLVTSDMPGFAQSVNDDTSYGHAVFAKSLEDSTENGEKTILAVII